MDSQSPCDDSRPRRQSSSHDSQASDDSHTALDFIRSQMQLEADAREALPYSIEHCTKPLGRLRQSVFACLTCHPPPESLTTTMTTTTPGPDAFDGAAGICYACSVQCHGDHTLVELFNKRNFTCDCGTTRFADSAPCRLRVDAATETRGDVHGEAPDAGNQYNQNFYNRFCGCALDYDPFQQKGTMFQCLGLGTHKTGGCGEDWWHPGCVVGLGPRWFDSSDEGDKAGKGGEGGEGGESGENGGVDKAGEADQADKADSALPTISEDAEDADAAGSAKVKADKDDADANAEDDEPPMPPGFPKEDDFEGFICYKCVDAYPWIRQYAGAPGFLPAVFYRETESTGSAAAAADTSATAPSPAESVSRKRKADDDADADDTDAVKRARGDGSDAAQAANESGVAATPSSSAPAPAPACKRRALPPPPPGRFSLFFRASFRDHLCRCADCFPLLKPHPQLLEEEETYEPPVSEDGSEAAGAGAGADADGEGNDGDGHSVGRRSGSGGGSLYERGESALRNVDRVRAIEGVMAYNHLKDKLKPFFQQFAESGQAISAEDIKAYFAKLRGDEQAIREAGEAARTDQRQEQDGY